MTWCVMENQSNYGIRIELIHRSTLLREGIKQTRIAMDETEQADIREHLQQAVEPLEMCLKALEQQDEK